MAKQKKKSNRLRKANKLFPVDIAKALSHDMRGAILSEMQNREPLSPVELAKLMDEGLSQISYHITVLKDKKLIELVKTAPRRGAVEHYYSRTKAMISLQDSLEQLNA